MKALLLAGCAVCALAAPALATQDPVPGPLDRRVGSFTYVENDVFRIWSVPGASFVIKLAEGETIDAATGADVCPKDAKKEDLEKLDCGIIAAHTGNNFLRLKFLKCLIPEDLLMTTKSPSGKMRMYNFEVHTEPTICKGPSPVPPPRPKGFELISTANAAELAAVEPGEGNLKWIKADAMTVKAPVPIFYSVSFRYPGDDAEKRKESGRERREREKKERVDYLLSREVDLATHDPWRGTAYTAYKFRGSSALLPRYTWDNQYSTAMTFPAMQKAPTLYQAMAPDGYQCRDDEPPPEEERQTQYAPRGDTIIITGTAKVWRLRDSEGRVLDVCNLNYNPVGATPGTGTISDRVRAVVRE